MLDVDRLYRELREYEAKKDEVIQLSIRVTRLSKSVIYSLIRGDKEAAKKFLDEMVTEAKRLRDLLNQYPMFYQSGSTGLQEYVEAVALWLLLTEGRLPSRDEVGVDVMTYLFGIADVAGELSRKATEELINRGDVELAKRFKDIVDRLYYDFLSLEPRDFELRKKVDYVGNVVNWINEKVFYKSACSSRG